MKQKNHSIASAARFKRVVLAAALAVVCASPAQVTRAEPDAPAISATVQPPCDMASFDAAWNLIPIGLGGTLTFNCGAAPVSINMSDTKTVNKQVTIDGGGKILLNGNFVTRHFVVNAGAALTLTNITIAGGGGGFYSDAGGAVQNFGTLTVLTSTFHTNQTGDKYGGGAIYSRGTLVIDNSIFRNNYAGYGGAIYNERVGDSQGDATIKNTQILSNTAKEGVGGGIDNRKDLLLKNVTIQGNRATNSPSSLAISSGGGIYNLGVMGYEDGVVTLNAAEGGHGGGIANRGSLVLRRVLIEKNSAKFYGGGVDARRPSDPGSCYTVINSVTLNENTALHGGGVAIAPDCEFNMGFSTVSDNTATDGGGLYLWGANSLARVRNSTFAMNKATNRGGGIFNIAQLTLTNVTLMQNQSPAGGGGGIYAQNGVTVVMVNTIIADSPAGGNCGGPAILSAVYTLSSDDTCTLSGPGNKSNTDPMLNTLGNYGGPTLTYLPKAGSPAIDGVIGSNAPDTDQRGFPRPQGVGYDIGAVERQPSDDTPPPPPPTNPIVPRIRIPIVLR